MIKLNIHEEKTLQFEVNIQGVEVDKLTGALQLMIGPVEYGFPVNISSETITIDMPPLASVIPEQTLPSDEVVTARLDIIGEGFYLNPWEGNFHISTPVRIEAKIAEDEEGDTLLEDIKKEIKVGVIKEVEVVSASPTKDLVDDKKSGVVDDITGITGEAKECQKEDNMHPKSAPIEDREKELKSPEQIKEDKIKAKLREMGPKKRKQILEMIKKKRISRAKTPQQLMESVGCNNPKIQETMLEQARSQGGDEPEMLMKNLSIVLGLRPPESMLEQVANSKIGKKMMED